MGMIRCERHGLLLTALLPLACGASDLPPEPSAPAPSAQQTTAALPASASRPSVAPPGASSAPPTVAPPIASTTQAPPSVRPPSTSRIGDTTCTADADCAITSQKECCDCCPSEPAATSRAWLSWRDGTQCNQIRCEPCAKNPRHPVCATVEAPSAFRAACVQKRCTLVRNP